MNFYSDLKAAWHTDRIAALRGGKPLPPAQIQLILSDLCNQDCSFCCHRSSEGFTSEQFAGPKGEKNPNRMMPKDKAIEILNDAATLGIDAIQFTGGGEPTVHPNHMALFGRAVALGMKAALVTNGTKLEEDYHDALQYFSWIRISLDAGSRKDYAALRKAPEHVFDDVLVNIARLAAMNGPRVGVGFVVTPDNWQGIWKACGLARDMGASYIRLSAVFSRTGGSEYAELRNRIENEIARAKEWNRKDFQVIDFFSQRVQDMEDGSPEYEFCGYQYFNMYIGANLKIYRCCTTSYTARGEVGDLSKMTLEEWFGWREAIEKRDAFDARGCQVCQFNAKNRIINYLKDPAPEHVEFV